MSDICSTLRRWLVDFNSKHGEKAERVPVTKVEVLGLMRDDRQTWTLPILERQKWCGSFLEETEFAQEMRMRRLTLPLIRVTEVETVAWEAWEMSMEKDEQWKRIQMRLTAHICMEQTALNVRVVCDPLEWWKRKLRLLRMFPLRECTLIVDARVLYPHIKVSLPFNRHVPQFRQRT